AEAVSEAVEGAAAVASAAIGGAGAEAESDAGAVSLTFCRESNLMEPEAEQDFLLCSAPFRSVQSHTQKAFCNINQMRLEGQLLCDVVLEAGTEEIPAHRVILASCSPYFRAMFTSELSESRQARVRMHQIDSRVLSALVDFIYTTEIHVTEDNVQALLPAANLLQLAEVREACCDFLQGQLHPSNCLGILRFADMHSCTELYNAARQYAEEYFSKVMQHVEEFLQLSYDQVRQLVCSDRLTCSAEVEVIEAVFRWIKHDLSGRQHHADSLLSHVRFAHLPQEYLLHIVEEEALLKESLRCKDFLIEALRYHLLKPDQKAKYRSERTRPRNPVGLPKILIVIGGQAPKAIRTVECFSFKEERWYPVSEMPSRRCRCGVALVGGLVYAVGGFNGSLRVRTCEVYDPVRDEWATVANMEARRSTLGVASLDGLVYAVGGFDGSSGLNTAEVYNPAGNKWSLIAPMSTRRSSVGVGILAGCLYAVGGYDGQSRQCLASVERYDPAQDAWHPVADMTCRRSGAGVGTLDGQLYAVGGHDGPLVRNSVERLNPCSGAWSVVANMHLCRRNAGVVAYNGFLFVVGGDDGSSNLGSVERYDPRTDSWVLLPNSMMTGRSYAGVAVIDSPL
ncbi:hypothetical protein BOX15_Mlig010639g4, partial [Macrostomum lignano]